MNNDEITAAIGDVEDLRRDTQSMIATQLLNSSLTSIELRRATLLATDSCIEAQARLITALLVMINSSSKE